MSWLSDRLGSDGSDALGWVANPGLALGTSTLTGGKGFGGFGAMPGSGGSTPDSGENWFGYMPENLQGFDKILADIMAGKGPTNPYMTGLQDQFKQNFRSAAADRGTAYAGFSPLEESRGMTDIYNQAQQGQVQDILAYLGLAAPRALKPQDQGPTTQEELFKLAGQIVPSLITTLPFL